MTRRGYRPIALNDVPEYSVWPARLLGAAPWTNINRDTDKVKEEYDRGSYAHCLEFLRGAKRRLTHKQIRAIEFGGGNPTVCASWGDNLFAVKLARTYEDYYDLIAKSVLPLAGNGTTVVELGCGYGYNLVMLQERTKKRIQFRGGEYSDNAVTLARELLSEKKDISVETFDFYDAAYPLLERETGPLIVFTAHAIEQIPDIRNLFEVLARYKKRIRAVVHIEPVFEFQTDGLLGLLRRRYIEVNDYNRNLYTEIEKRHDIQIEKRRENVFGINGLNPSSVIVWRYKRP